MRSFRADEEVLLPELAKLNLRKRDGAVAGVLTVFAVVMNLLFQVLMARSLGPDDYSLLTIFLVGVSTAGVAASGVQVVAARDISASKSVDPLTFRLDPLIRSCILFCCLLGIAIALFSGPIAHALHSDIWLVLVFALFLPVAGLFAVTNGRLQGRGLLVLIAGMSAILSLFKLLGSITVVGLGEGVVSVAIVMTFTTTLIVLPFLYSTRRFGQVKSRVWTKHTGHAVLVQTAYWLLLSIDLLIARVRLEANVAGQFAVADMLAKSVLLLPSLVLIVMLPRYVQARELGVRATALTIKAIGLTLILMLPGIAVLVVGGDWIVSKIFGADYVYAPGAVGILAVMMIPLGLAGILVQFHLARESFTAGLLMLFAVVGTACLLWFTSSNPYLFVSAVGVGGVFALLCLVPISRIKQTRSILHQWLVE